MLKEFQRHTLEKHTVMISDIIKTRTVRQEHAAINKKGENKKQLLKSETSKRLNT